MNEKPPICYHPICEVCRFREWCENSHPMKHQGRIIWFSLPEEMLNPNDLTPNDKLKWK